MQLLVRQPTMGSKEIGLIPILQNHIKVGKRKQRNWTNTWYCRKTKLLVFQFHGFVSLASYSQNSSQFIRSITPPSPLLPLLRSTFFCMGTFCEPPKFQWCFQTVLCHTIFSQGLCCYQKQRAARRQIYSELGKISSWQGILLSSSLPA